MAGRPSGMVFKGPIPFLDAKVSTGTETKEEQEQSKGRQRVKRRRT